MSSNKLKALKITTSQFILDWDAVRKGKMIGYVSLCITLWDMVLGNLVFVASYWLNLLPVEHSITKSGYWFMMYFATFYACLCSLCIFMGNQVRNKSKDAREIYMYACMLLYTFGNIVVAHTLGLLSLPSGILMTGAPIIGWILFNNRGVLLCVIFSLACIVPLYLLSFFGVIKYAPIIDVNTSQMHRNISYNVVMLGSMLPHLLSLLLLAYLSITHWKKREEHANYLAGTDTLTNVPNRRQFFIHLHDSIEDTSITAQPVSIMMLDLDNFKYINDNFGHITGDDVLNQTIVILASCLRDADIIGRFGGDEFVVLLPNTNATVAEKIAQRCLDVIGATPVKTEQGLFNITASFGLTTLYEAPNPVDVDAISRELILKADDALYQAKRNGRNCFVVAA